MDPTPQLSAMVVISSIGAALGVIGFAIAQRAGTDTGLYGWMVLVFGIMAVAATVLLIILHVQAGKADDHSKAEDDPERGSASLELAVLAPALLVLLALIIVAGRVAVAHQAVEGAASQAARAASLERTAPAAADRAHAVAGATLANAGLHCTGTSVSVDTSGFDVAVGTPASVTATVTCTVDLAGLATPVGPTTITKTASSAIDTYRER